MSLLPHGLVLRPGNVALEPGAAVSRERGREVHTSQLVTAAPPVFRRKPAALRELGREIAKSPVPWWLVTVIASCPPRPQYFMMKWLRECSAMGRSSRAMT